MQGNPKLSICTIYNPPCQSRRYPKRDCQVRSHKGTDRRKVPHRSMGTDIHRRISNAGCVKWRSWRFYPLPGWADCVAGRPNWKTLQQQWCRGASALDSGLCHRDSKQRLPSVGVRDRCPLRAGSFCQTTRNHI